MFYTRRDEKIRPFGLTSQLFCVLKVIVYCTLCYPANHTPFTAMYNCVIFPFLPLFVPIYLNLHEKQFTMTVFYDATRNGLIYFPWYNYQK